MRSWWSVGPVLGVLLAGNALAAPLFVDPIHDHTLAGVPHGTYVFDASDVRELAATVSETNVTFEIATGNDPGLDYAFIDYDIHMVVLGAQLVAGAGLANDEVGRRGVAAEVAWDIDHVTVVVPMSAFGAARQVTNIHVTTYGGQATAPAEDRAPDDGPRANITIDLPDRGPEEAQPAPADNTTGPATAAPTSSTTSSPPAPRVAPPGTTTETGRAAASGVAPPPPAQESPGIPWLASTALLAVLAAWCRRRLPA